LGSQVQHIELAGLGVDHEGALGGRVKRRDFCRALQEDAGGIPTDLFQLQGAWRGLEVVIAATAGGKGGGSHQGEAEKMPAGGSEKRGHA